MNKHLDEISTGFPVSNPQVFHGGLRQIIGLALGALALVVKMKKPTVLSEQWVRKNVWSAYPIPLLLVVGSWVRLWQL